MRHYIFSNHSIATRNGREEFLDTWGDTAGIYNMHFAFYETDSRQTEIIADVHPEDDDDEHKQIQYSNADENSEQKGSVKLFLELYRDTKEQHESGNTQKNKTLVFVYGHWVSVEKSADFLNTIHEKYVKNKDSSIRRIIMFSWPSVAGKFFPKTFFCALNHAKTEDRCASCGTVLLRFYMKLLRFANQFVKVKDTAMYNVFINNFSLMTQSMGNMILLSFVKKLTCLKKPNCYSLKIYL